MKPGIYYFKKDLRMVETAWLDRKASVLTVWTYHDIKSGRGFLTTIPVKAFKKYFKYLGEV
jgi:hypothetical protein